MMKHNRSAQVLPKELEHATDARAIFNYLFKKARLWPEYKMSPREGDVRKIVLFSEGFNDKTVTLLQQIPKVKYHCRSIEEVRLVCTKITPTGVARLKALFGKSVISVVGCDEWEKNVNTGNPDFDLKTGKFQATTNAGPTTNGAPSGSREKFVERYGR
ncbi:MAG TPA: hypothetical protein VKY92_25425 [Verrucomicrobiae bacterium]|nr:hypothetical protein [Verrucomicrobiae bacterium]